MKAIILAAGKGERMRPLTLAKPKPLLEVCGISLIEHHIINLKNAGYTQLVINVCWLAQQIMQKLGDGSQYGVQIKYSFEGDEPLETGGGIFKALPLLDNKPFLVVNADIKTDFDFKPIEIKPNILAHLIMISNPDHNLKGDFYFEQGYLTEQSSQSKNKLTYSGMGIYHPNLFDHCQHGKYSVVPLLKQAMIKNQVTAEFYDGNWDDIGTIDRLIEINRNCKKINQINKY